MSSVLTYIAAGVATVDPVNNGTGEDLSAAIVPIINAVIGVLGIICVIVVLIGGINYMTSQGDPGKVKKAKDTILYGVIGLIISALSFAIVNFVIVKIIGSESSGGGPISAGDCYQGYNAKNQTCQCTNADHKAKKC